MQTITIDTYKLTSMEEPSEEILSQLMKEAAEDAREANIKATNQFFDELKKAAEEVSI